MAAVPGSAGVPLISDRSYEFYKDPIKFQNKYMKETKSRVFLSRFLNKPTIFAGSNSIVKELLNGHSEKMEFGYKMFMGEIFGDNILFMDGECAVGMRETLGQLFTTDAVETYQDTIDSIVTKAVTELSTGDPICVYKFFKRLAVEICLSLFLGLDFSHLDAQVIADLTITHWHGIISVPVAIKLPHMNASTYSKAMDAKHRLLEIIKKRREEKKHSFPQRVENLPSLDEVHINNHLLLFTSALVPKALSSILTSFLTVLGTEEHVGMQDLVLNDAELLDSFILEILRLYPPFLGGRRMIKQDIHIDGYKLPEGSAVLYLTYAAQRDSAVFESPDEFKPGRWQSKNKDDKDKLFCFGSGPRRCIGKKLVWDIITTVIMEVLRKYRFALVPGQDLTHKWLPVSRPKGNVMMTFEPRTSTQET